MHNCYMIGIYDNSYLYRLMVHLRIGKHLKLLQTAINIFSQRMKLVEMFLRKRFLYSILQLYLFYVHLSLQQFHFYNKTMLILLLFSSNAVASLGLLTGHTPAITAIRISPRRLESEQPLQHFPSVYLAPAVGEVQEGQVTSWS